MKLKNNHIRGKNAERRVAKYFNGKRLGILGKEDVITDNLIIEVKSRKSLSFEKWYNQLVKNIEKNSNKIPIVVAIKKNQKIDNAFVIISVKDFKKLINKK